MDFFDRFGMPFFTFEADDGAGSGDTPPVTPKPEDKTEEPPAPLDAESLAKELDKWKSLSRKHEERAKANATAATELEKIRASQMSEQEKAVAEALSKGKADAMASFGERIAAAEIKAALTGVVPDPSALVEDLNLSKYVAEDGSVNAEAVSALRDKYAKFATPKPQPVDLGQGNQGKAPAGQLTRADLRKMSPEQVVQARNEGRLDSLMQGKF